MRSHPSMFCSFVASDVVSLFPVLSPICHALKPSRISCQISGAVCALISHCSSWLITVVQVFMASVAWHCVWWALLSACCWHRGHLSSCLSFHLFIFVPYSKNCATDFATHLCWAFGNPLIARPAMLKLTIIAFPVLYRCFLSQCSLMVMVLICVHRAELMSFTCQWRFM